MTDNIKPELIKTLRSKNLNDINKGKLRTKSVNLDFTDIDPTFVGNVVFHYPSQMERMSIGVQRAQLLGGNIDVDVQTGNLAHIIATLDNVMDSKPDWFDVYSPQLEYEILEAVYDEYAEWERNFRNRGIKAEPSLDSSNGRSEVSVVDTKGVESTTN